MKRTRIINVILAILLILTIFIPASLSDQDRTGKKPAGTEEMDLSAQTPTEGENASADSEQETGKPSSAWKKAPTGLKIVARGGMVTLSWKHAKNADRYAVYEVVSGKEKKVGTVTARKAELMDVEPGAHEYRVAAQKKSGGKWKTGEKSKSVAVTVAEWAAAPTKAKGTVSDVTVSLKWEYTGKAKSFNVYEMVKGEPKLVTRVSGKKKCSFRVSDAGTHRYYIVARKKVDGAWAYGDRSKTVKVKVEDYEKDGVIYALSDSRWTVKKLKNEKAISLTVPEKILGMKVTAIGNSAFAGGTRLKEIHLPDTILEIGDNAFDQCERLEIMD